MGEIIQIGIKNGHHETVEEFIRREKRVSTENVSMRFGWPIAEARKRLKVMASEGKIVNFGLKINEYGTTLEWGPVE